MQQRTGHHSATPPLESAHHRTARRGSSSGCCRGAPVISRAARQLVRHADPSGCSSRPGVHVADHRVAGQRSHNFAERTKSSSRGMTLRRGRRVPRPRRPSAVGTKPRETEQCLRPPRRTVAPTVARTVARNVAHGVVRGVQEEHLKTDVRASRRARSRSRCRNRVDRRAG